VLHNLLPNTLPFLGLFAALVAVYYLIPHRFRWLLLLLASLYFYATFKLSYVALLAGFTLFVYLMSLVIAPRQGGRRPTGLLVGALVGALVPLLVFKYYNFFLGSLDTVRVSWLGLSPLNFSRLGWLLPAGLSFYTFSCVSYLADVYRGKLPVEKHPGRMALYVAFFPKLLAGPIDRATTFLPQLLKPVQFNGEDVTLGLQMVLWGLVKKVIIADRLVVFVNQAYQSPGQASPVDLVLGSYLFAFQIYCDFSGYTDMAIGLARVLGIRIMINFRRPFFSTSLGEFWSQRWHISLTRWMRDYMFIPMGGSRVPKWRLYLNLVVVFAVSGLWHGAAWTFVIWGTLMGVYQSLALVTAPARNWIAKLLRVPGKVGTVISALTVFHLWLTGNVFFRANSFSDAVTLFKRVGQAFTALPSQFANKPYSRELLLSFGLMGALVVVEVMEEKWNLWEKLRLRPVYVRWPVYYALALSLIALGVWKQTTFVYMGF
jgi:alginate O-acetyltransferase complex protein AlgI